MSRADAARDIIIEIAHQLAWRAGAGSNRSCMYQRSRRSQLTEV